MGNDYHTVDIDSWEILNGVEVPKDEHGHYLNWTEVSLDRKQARQLTSPYGTLHFAVGNAEGDEECDGDFTTFFDYAELPDGRMILHSVVNTDSGGYIGDGQYLVVSQEAAYPTAMDMVWNALEGVALNEVRHDTEGWNQDPNYFARCVRAYVEGESSLDVERIVGGQS